MKTSIIIPVYNEEQTLPDFLSKLRNYLQGNETEIILVNDGSTDSSESIIKQFPEFIYIKHPYNKGYGAAVKTGARAAKG